MVFYFSRHGISSVRSALVPRPAPSSTVYPWMAALSLILRGPICPGQLLWSERMSSCSARPPLGAETAIHDLCLALRSARTINFPAAWRNLRSCAINNRSLLPSVCRRTHQFYSAAPEKWHLPRLLFTLQRSFFPGKICRPGEESDAHGCLRARMSCGHASKHGHHFPRQGDRFLPSVLPLGFRGHFNAAGCQRSGRISVHTVCTLMRHDRWRRAALK